MAAREYVNTNLVAGANDGTTWPNAWRTDPTAIVQALASMDAGGFIYIQSDCIHEFGGDIILSSTRGVSNNPCTIVSVKNFNEPPVEGDFETMMVGGGKLDAKANGAFDINLEGWDIWNGLELIIGDDFNPAYPVRDVDVIIINCKISVDDTCNISGYDNHVYFEAVDYKQVTAARFNVLGAFSWVGGSFVLDGGSIDTNLFDCGSTKAGILHISDVDIQDLDAGDYLVSDVNTGWDVLIKRCKIPAACNYMNNGPTGAGCKVRFHSVDDGNLIHRFNEYYFEGQILDDVAVYRDDAAKYDGTNEYSVKMVTNANAKEWTRPLRFKLDEKWFPANPIITVELNTDNVVFQNDEFWLEIEYPDGTTGALGKIDRTSKSATILTAPTNLATSTAAWTEGFGTEKPQKVTVAISGGQAGMHTIWACQAKPNTTAYVCPKIGIGPIDANFIIPGSGIVEAGFPGVVSPSEDDVEDGVPYGAGGTEFEGNFEAPAEDDAEDGVGYGSHGTEFTGNVTLPGTAKVEKNFTYGANGTEFTGTMETVEIVEEISVTTEEDGIIDVAVEVE